MPTDLAIAAPYWSISACSAEAASGGIRSSLFPSVLFPCPVLPTIKISKYSCVEDIPSCDDDISDEISSVAMHEVAMIAKGPDSYMYARTCHVRTVFVHYIFVVVWQTCLAVWTIWLVYLFLAGLYKLFDYQLVNRFRETAAVVHQRFLLFVEFICSNLQHYKLICKDVSIQAYKAHKQE